MTYIRTSILESKAQTVTNTVNTVGIMGKGLASDMKRRHPDMFREYAKLCAAKRLNVGQLWLWKGQSQWILNFPTNGIGGTHEAVLHELGLIKFVDEYERRGIWEISFPRLGCRNRNLDWEDVRPLMERYFANLPIQVYVHDYNADIRVPEHARTSNVAIFGFKQSFPKFIADLGAVIYANRGVFLSMGSKNNTRLKS